MRSSMPIWFMGVPWNGSKSDSIDRWFIARDVLFTGRYRTERGKD